MIAIDPRRYGPLLLAGGAWLALGASAQGLMLPGLCGGAGPGAIDLWLRLNPPGTMLAHGAAMLAAMMLPMVLPNLAHVADRARPGAWLGWLGFALGYTAAWLVALAVLAIGAAVVETGGMPAVPMLLGLALGWQETPVKARALARCHYRPAIRWRGLGLGCDGVAFGARTGLWCVAGCWPWMLLCLHGAGGVAAMAAISAVLWWERFAGVWPVRVSDGVRWAYRWVVPFPLVSSMR